MTLASQLSEESHGLADELAYASWLRMGYRLDMILGYEPIALECLLPHEQGAWLDGYARAMKVAAEGEGRTFERLAEDAHRAFTCALNHGVEIPFGDILPEIRLKWNFLLRHAAQILTWTSDDEAIDVFEESLAEVFRQKLTEIKEFPNGSP